MAGRGWPWWILMARPMTSSDPLLLPPRADLYQALIDRTLALGVEIKTLSVAVAARAEGVLVLETGEELEADLIVAADGAYSRLRETILATRWMDYGLEAGIRMLIDHRAGDPGRYLYSVLEWTLEAALQSMHQWGGLYFSRCPYRRSSGA